MSDIKTRIEKIQEYFKDERGFFEAFLLEQKVACDLSCEEHVDEILLGDPMFATSNIGGVKFKTVELWADLPSFAKDSLLTMIRSRLILDHGYLCLSPDFYVYTAQVTDELLAQYEEEFKQVLQTVESDNYQKNTCHQQ